MEEALNEQERNELIKAIKNSPSYIPSNEVPEGLLNRRVYEIYLKEKNKLVIQEPRELRRKQMMNKFRAYFKTVPTPICHKCWDYVRVFGVDYNPDKERYEFRVGCHKEKEMWIADGFNIFELPARDSILPRHVFAEGDKKVSLIEGLRVGEVDCDVHTRRLKKN